MIEISEKAETTEKSRKNLKKRNFSAKSRRAGNTVHDCPTCYPFDQTSAQVRVYEI